MNPFSLPTGPKKKKDAEPAESIGIPGSELSCSLEFSRRRTLSLTLHPDGGMVVRAPLGTDRRLIEAFLQSRLDWIRKKLAYFTFHAGTAPTFENGSELPHLGRPVRIAAAYGSRQARLEGSTLFLPVPKDRLAAGPEELRPAYLAWRLAEAKRILGPRLEQLDALARRILGDGRKFTSLTVRSMKSRWGSCSAAGGIVLASQLIALPQPLIDYVLLHELCHLRHMDHGPAFHADLERLLPGEREKSRLIHVWSLEHPRIV